MAIILPYFAKFGSFRGQLRKSGWLAINRLQGSYGQGKSGKTERVREKSGNFKILPTRPIIYASLFSQFLSASGGDPHQGSTPVNTAG